jgi:hypothetical protein
MLITSDGGSESMGTNQASISLPLIFIYKNHRINSTPQSLTYHLKDIAPTLSQILGIPIP